MNLKMWSVILSGVVFSVLVLSVSGHDDAEHRMHPNFKNVESTSKVFDNPEELESNFWRAKAQSTLTEKLAEKLNTNKAKNLIIFLGDGMSLATVAATRVYIGGEEQELEFEKFPHFGLSKTYCVNRQVSDSACTATAYLCGVKGNYGTIGVDANVQRYDCEAELNSKFHPTSIAKWAQDAGKATGIITTTRITHASPAGNYAHTANRYWENDVELLDSCPSGKNSDIGEQLIFGEIGSKFNVILGGGRGNLLDESIQDEEGDFGNRQDGQNLIDTWKTNRNKVGKASYVWNKSGLNAVNVDETDYLLGLFESDHCKYAAEGGAEEPSLSEMVAKAIEMLKKNTNGFYLFVEGGRIDTAHHETYTRLALDETKEFANAVKTARDLNNVEDTLIVVTSDHSHTMTYNGYGLRHDDILGLNDKKGEDGLPYLTLSYANGKSFYNTYDNSTGKRVDLSTVDISGLEYTFSSTVPLTAETHAGDDVGVYASGPWSHLFLGNYEQNNIPILMSYAAKIGIYTSDAGSSTARVGLIASGLFILMTKLFLK